jgi:hypothetical protein
MKKKYLLVLKIMIIYQTMVHQILQERLVSTGKFYAGEAVLMIEHLEKIGKIEQTGDYHVYRLKKPAALWQLKLVVSYNGL